MKRLEFLSNCQCKVAKIRPKKKQLQFRRVVSEKKIQINQNVKKIFDRI